LSSPAAKNVPLFEQVETAIERRHPVPDKEGRFAIVTTRWAQDAMDAMTHETKALIADGEAVWS
jgi:6,7-dimethyl-8-ribityllumazine synthase